MKRRRIAGGVLAAFLLFSLAAGARAEADPASERAAAKRLDAVRTQPLLLRRFMQALPKGADLHNHASGAVYAERLIDWAVRDGLCVDASYNLLPCNDNKQPPSPAPPAMPASAATAVPTTTPVPTPVPGRELLEKQLADSAFRDHLIDALSMRAFVPRTESGHDHFFNAFGKFGEATKRHGPDVVAEAVRQAARDRVDYLELMVTFGSASPGPTVGDVAKKVKFDRDFDKLRASLNVQGFADVVTAAREELQNGERARRELMRCDRAPAEREPGCRVQLRYLQQVNRRGEAVSVFAQTMLGFELARRDEHLVGVNFVSPEDGLVAVRDYALHMRMIAYLRRTIGDVPVSLHAGELTLGLVPRNVLDDHIDQAVNVAGARRIGHGVDIAYERNEPALLRTMAARRVLVEIALTSNDGILGVRGAQHPIRLYLAAGVPLALVTDDEGISRIDLTNEFVRAARDYGFSYMTFKRFVRNSAEYAFLKGASLWLDAAAGRPVAACARTPATANCSTFLAANPRAALEWKVERELDAFEARVRRGDSSTR